VRVVRKLECSWSKSDLEVRVSWKLEWSGSSWPLYATVKAAEHFNFVRIPAIFNVICFTQFTAYFYTQWLAPLTSKVAISLAFCPITRLQKKCIWCFDTVGWATGIAPSLESSATTVLLAHQQVRNTMSHYGCCFGCKSSPWNQYSVVFLPILVVR